MAVIHVEPLALNPKPEPPVPQAKYPFDFQLLDIVIDPWSVSSDKLSLLVITHTTCIILLSPTSGPSGRLKLPNLLAHLARPFDRPFAFQ